MQASLNSKHSILQSEPHAAKSLARNYAAEVRRKATVILSVLVLLSACSEQQKYDATALAAVRTIQVGAQLSAANEATTNATPRGKQAGAGAVGGAVIGAGIWVTDPLLLAAAILAPGAVLVTTAVGGVVGGAVGAATGISASEEQIAAAVSVLNQSFKPARHQRQFEEEFAKSLESQFAAVGGPCVSSRQDRRKCGYSRGVGQIDVFAEMGVVASRNGGGAGGLDIVSNIIVRTKPAELLKPECLGWSHRARAGNLIKLANDGGRPFQARLQQVLSEVAQELPRIMFKERTLATNEKPDTKSAVRPRINNQNWKKVPCL